MSGKVESCASNSYALLTLTCDICHKYFNGRKPYNDHLQSNNHKKKLKEKALLNVASQENFKSNVTTLQADEVHNYNLNTKKQVIDGFQNGKLHGHENSNTVYLEGWKPIENSASPVFFPKSVEESKPFYVECAVCQLYFTSEKSATMHFSSDEHKSKDAQHREIEELYNSIKNVDIQEIVENLLYEAPSLNSLENNVKTNITPQINCKPHTFQAGELKLPFSDCKSKNKPYSDVSEFKLPLNDGRTKKTMHPGVDEIQLPLADGRTNKKLNPSSDELKLPLGRTKKKLHPSTDGLNLPLSDGGRTKDKLYPGCEVCGINSFCSVISSLNHLTTAEHCRKVAMQAEAARLNSKLSGELPLVSSSIDLTQKAKENNYVDITAIPHIISSNCDFYGTNEQVERNRRNVSLNPIGYERKQKHQHNQQLGVVESLYLPDYDKASSSTAQCFSEALLNPISQGYKSAINNDVPLISQTASQKFVSKPFPRLAATFPQQ